MLDDMYDFLHPDYKNILSGEQERIVYEMFSTHSEVFRSDYIISNKDKRAIWNSVIVSLPKCERRKVYRYLNEYDRTNFHIGEILKVEHSLTTTKLGRKFTSPSNYIGKYIITCKPPTNTKAHDVSVLWNDSMHWLKGEKQVNFEDGTSFQIDRVKQIHNKPFIYMHEL